MIFFNWASFMTMAHFRFFKYENHSYQFEIESSMLLFFNSKLPVILIEIKNSKYLFINTLRNKKNFLKSHLNE